MFFWFFKFLAKISLSYLQKWYEREVVFSPDVVIQRPGAILRRGGVPVDRPYWYFLPYLGPDRERRFQPREGRGGEKIYHLPRGNKR